MSYLKKLADLQQRSQEAKKQDALYKESVRNDAFSTAEAKKDDYLGAISRHLEDANNKLQTAMGLAQTTSAIAKHGKKIREVFKDKKPAVTRDDSLRTPAPDASAEADSSARPALQREEPPVGEERPIPVEEYPFPEQELQRRLGAGESHEPTTSAPERVTGASEQPAPPASEEGVTAPEEDTRLFKDVPRAEDITVGGGGIRPPLREGPAPLVQSPEQSEQLGRITNQRGNLSTEADTQSAESRLVPESSRSAPAPTPESGGGGGGALTQELEDGAGTLLKTDAPEMATNLIGDTLLSAIPIVGDIATGASLIGSLVEDLKAHSAEKKVEDTMTPDSERGTAVASTGFDGEALQHS